MGNPPVTGKITGIHVMYITGAKVYSELWWLKDTVGRLRFRYESEGKNNEYETKLLQVSCTLHLKLLQNGGYFLKDGMKGKLFNGSYTGIRAITNQ